MDSTELTRKVKQLALDNDLDFVRIAPVERWANAPVDHKPADLLPSARSVVSMGIKLNLGVQLSHRIGMANNKYRHVAFSYRWFGYGLLNMYFMDRAAFLVTRLLEKEGFVSVPIVASGVEAGRNFMAPFSNRHAAVAAGHGEFGWNGLCLTPEAGPRNRFVSVITSARLDPDPLYSGERICDLKKCRELGGGVPVCVKICPVKAFSLNETQKLVIDNREFHYALLNKPRCVAMGLQLSKAALGLKDIALPEQLDDRTAPTLENQIHVQQRMEYTFYYRRSHGCGQCLLLCPARSSEVLDKIIEKVPRI